MKEVKKYCWYHDKNEKDRTLLYITYDSVKEVLSTMAGNNSVLEAVVYEDFKCVIYSKRKYFNKYDYISNTDMMLTLSL